LDTVVWLPLFALAPHVAYHYLQFYLDPTICWFRTTGCARAVVHFAFPVLLLQLLCVPQFLPRLHTRSVPHPFPHRCLSPRALRCWLPRSRAVRRIVPVLVLVPSYTWLVQFAPGCLVTPATCCGCCVLVPCRYAGLYGLRRGCALPSTRTARAGVPAHYGSHARYAPHSTARLPRTRFTVPAVAHTRWTLRCRAVPLRTAVGLRCLFCTRVWLFVYILCLYRFGFCCLAMPPAATRGCPFAQLVVTPHSSLLTRAGSAAVLLPAVHLVLAAHTLYRILRFICLPHRGLPRIAYTTCVLRVGSHLPAVHCCPARTAARCRACLPLVNGCCTYWFAHCHGSRGSALRGCARCQRFCFVPAGLCHSTFLCFAARLPHHRIYGSRYWRAYLRAIHCLRLPAVRVLARLHCVGCRFSPRWLCGYGYARYVTLRLTALYAVPGSALLDYCAQFLLRVRARLRSSRVTVTRFSWLLYTAATPAGFAALSPLLYLHAFAVGCQFILVLTLQLQLPSPFPGSHALDYAPVCHCRYARCQLPGCGSGYATRRAACQFCSTYHYAPQFALPFYAGLRIALPHTPAHYTRARIPPFIGLRLARCSRLYAMPLLPG